MLTIKIPDSEYFDESTQKFIPVKGCTLNLEHSLISISKWESKWCKPFLTKDPMTQEQYRDYIVCMSLTPIDPIVLLALTPENIETINTYIDAPMTATTFSNTNTKQSKEVITSEILYYRMIIHNIPIECQKWHLNRLLTLIRICDIKSSGKKPKGNKSATLSHYAQLNAARRARFNSKG